MDLKQAIKNINLLLQEGEKKGNFSEDHKGYTGYKPQYVIDAVNSELLGEWSLEILEKQTYPTRNKKGEEVKNAFVTVRLKILDKAIDSVASHPILDDVGDAFKSAQTDAMKKAFAHFSIGNRAYHGLLVKNK